MDVVIVTISRDDMKYIWKKVTKPAAYLCQIKGDWNIKIVLVLYKCTCTLQQVVQWVPEQQSRKS